ncbi:MAG TPA: M28 family metallopeptidase [Thermoanaerobaculia bacterium]|jgi:hypothetical protein
MNLLLILALAGAAPRFRAEPIRAHMTFLASDLLEGRGTATRGHEIAASYVASQFEAAGLEPGANGSWYQRVPFLQTTGDPSSTVTITRRGAAPVVLRNFERFTTYGDPLRDDSIIEGDVVFAGYGVTAPDQGYDDYANVDVRGKIVALASGAPPRFANPLRAHHSSTIVKMENAAKHGAVGLIFIRTPADDRRAPWARSVRQSRLGSMHWLRADGTPNAVFPEVSTSINFGADATSLLFDNPSEVAETIERGTPKAAALPVHVRAHLVSKHAKVSSPNVVGLLRGSDPQLRDEYLVYTGHLDHLGITEAVNGDGINNGALDNAAGIAIMLEVAHALAAGPRPRRSILIVATTAEEKGLRGADYFANNPPVPASQIVADLNIDMPMLLHRARDLTAIGAETSDLGDVAREVARDMQVELSPDPIPEEVIFVRSDQYPFIRRGIPSLYIDSGYHAVEAGVDMQREFEEWLATRYHSPSDDLQQPIDYEAALPLTEFEYRLGLAIANRTERPRWKPGDFFGITYGRAAGR